MTYRLESDGTWTVVCTCGDVIETGYLSLAYATQEVDEDERCSVCRSERLAEIRSGIPREYNEN